MICIHEDVLRQFGMDDDEIEALARHAVTHGIWPSSRAGFAASGERRIMGMSMVDWLLTERPPRLLLVGMTDQFGAGRRVAGQDVLAIHVAEDGSGPARLTSDERARLPAVMLPYHRGSETATRRALRDFFGVDSDLLGATGL